MSYRTWFFFDPKLKSNFMADGMPVYFIFFTTLYTISRDLNLIF